jgi:hypothetical protein
MAKKGSAAALPIMQQEAEAGNAIDETELAPENPDAPIEVPGGEAPATAKPTEATPAKPKTESETVPISRLNEVISERNKLREDWARLDERRKLADQITKQAEDTAAAARLQAQRPDPDVDPQGAALFDMRQEVAALKAQVPQLQQNYQQTTQQLAIDREQQQLNQWVNNDVARVTAAHPDYAAARDYLAQKRVGHYMAMGHDQNAAIQLFNLERAAYERQCATNGTSIAELAYKFAQDLGYQSPQANGNGHTQANGAPNGQARIAQLKNGQAMQGLGGKVPSGESDPNANIAAMNAAQLAEHLATMTEEEWTAKMNADPKYRAAMNQKFAELG